MRRSDEFQTIKWWFIAIVLVVATIAVLYVVNAVLYPARVEMQREADQNSTEFVQTIVSQLQADYTAYLNGQANGASPAQLQALVNKMHGDLNKLSVKARETTVPTDIVNFLIDHKATQ